MVGKAMCLAVGLAARFKGTFKQEKILCMSYDRPNFKIVTAVRRPPQNGKTNTMRWILLGCLFLSVFGMASILRAAQTDVLS